MFNLDITHVSGYKLKFYASSPLNMTHIKGFTDSFDVERREMDAVITIPSTLTESESFDVKVELMEKGTNTPFSYNDWQVGIATLAALCR